MKKVIFLLVVSMFFFSAFVMAEESGLYKRFEESRVTVPEGSHGPDLPVVVDLETGKAWVAYPGCKPGFSQLGLVTQADAKEYLKFLNERYPLAGDIKWMFPRKNDYEDIFDGNSHDPAIVQDYLSKYRKKILTTDGFKVRPFFLDGGKKGVDLFTGGELEAFFIDAGELGYVWSVAR